MKRSKNIFFIDLMSILPDDIECLIQAPDLENHEIESMLQDSEFEYFKKLQLDCDSKKKVIRLEEDTFFTSLIQGIEIRERGTLLFEGFDGVQFGSISSKINVPGWFREKYIPNNLLGFIE